MDVLDGQEDVAWHIGLTYHTQIEDYGRRKENSHSTTKEISYGRSRQCSQEGAER